MEADNGSTPPPDEAIELLPGQTPARTEIESPAGEYIVEDRWMLWKCTIVCKLRLKLAGLPVAIATDWCFVVDLNWGSIFIPDSALFCSRLDSIIVYIYHLAFFFLFSFCIVIMGNPRRTTRITILISKNSDSNSNSNSDQTPNYNYLPKINKYFAVGVGFFIFLFVHKTKRKRKHLYFAVTFN